ncbi:MAG TPA: hypothetical protein VH040_00355 [Usitatibacter sp.]|jgi:uncharacterized membrane protein|nr:hypothetical protein [Usitatibacter sp.]
MATIETSPAPTGTTQVMYLMHAIAPFTLWTLALIALIVGAVTRDSVRGTWVETHYSWLLRTCLWGILWAIIGGVITVLLVLTIVGILISWLPFTIVAIWYLYRVIRGWLLLNERRPAP